MWRPSTSAGFRSMAGWKCIGGSIGKSADLAPSRICRPEPPWFGKGPFDWYDIRLSSTDNVPAGELAGWRGPWAAPLPGHLRPP